MVEGMVPVLILDVHVEGQQMPENETADGQRDVRAVLIMITVTLSD